MSEIGFIHEMLWYARIACIVLVGIWVNQAIDAWHNTKR